MTVLVHYLGPWLPIMPLDTPGPLLDHCCIQSLGVGPRRWFKVNQGGPQWSRVVQRAPEGKTNFLTFLLMYRREPYHVGRQLSQTMFHNPLSLNALGLPKGR